tara:strand:+ start:6758 stop:7516 length:759 start_codon:yes stop_codon:yes gene_type:complete
MNIDSVINSLFLPRKTIFKQDENDHLIETSDGIKIGIRLFMKNKNFINILYFHGNAELAVEYSDIASFYNNIGANLIVSDYRGYGLSNGNPNKYNLLSDANCIFKYVNNYLTKNNYLGKKIIMGRSLGCASALEIVSNYQKFIDACIIESGFIDELPIFKLFNIDIQQYNYNISDGFENLKKIKKLIKPLLIIHAELDHIIPYNQTKLMINNSSSKKKYLCKIKGANHNNLIMIDKNLYFQSIQNLIQNLDD